MEFFRQAYWSGLPFPSPGDLPDPGIEPGFLHYQEILYCLSHFDGFLPSTLGHVYLELGQRAIESEPRKNFQHLELLLHQSNSASLKRNFCLYLKQTLSSPCPEPFLWLCLLSIAVFSSCGEEDCSLIVVRRLLLQQLSCCRAQALGSRALGLHSPRHVDSSWTRDRTHVLCTGRQILYHWTPREVSES